MNDIKSIRFPPPVADAMVRAILEGRKTVTRRVVKLQPTNPRFNNIGWLGWDDGHWYKMRQPCLPGQILYVRETFRVDYLSNISGSGRVRYKADDTYADFRFAPERYEMMRRAQIKPGWRPNENMPKEAVRLFLRVTGVKVQKAKEITEGEAIAEGFASREEFVSCFLKMYPNCTEDSWVWVIGFERINKEEAIK